MNNDISKSIVEYFRVDNDRAIMINGKWGSGKTYFLKQTLMSYLETELNNTKSIYISLYGCTSVDWIDKQIVSKMLQSSSSKLATVLPNIGRLIDIADSAVSSSLKKKLLSLLKSSINDDSANNLINGKIKFNIIFDDLERSNVDYIEVLGYINHLCEHTVNNIVVVANQDELLNFERHENIELKYITSLLADDFEVTEEPSIDSAFRSKYIDQKEHKVKIDNLMKLSKKTEDIFGNITEYKKIKEKTIYRTYTYQPRMEDVFSEMILTSNVSDETKTALVENTEHLVKAFNRFQCTNLRTFETVIFTLDHFLDSIVKYNEHRKYERVVQNIVESVLLVIEGVNEIQNDMRFFILEETTTFDYPYIEKHLKGEISDLALFAKRMKEYIDDKVIDDNDPIKKLRNFLFLSQVEVEDLINELSERVQNDEYPTSIYAELIYALISLEDIGIDTKIDNIVSILKSNIHGDTLDSPDRYFEYNDYLSKDALNKYFAYLEEIKKASSDTLRKNISEKMNDSIVDFNFTKLFDDINKNESQIVQNGGWLHMFNMDHLLQFLTNADNSSFINFMRTLNHDFFYSRESNFNLYKNDYDSFYSLVDWLEKVSFVDSDLIKEANRIRFLEIFKNEIENRMTAR